MSRSEQEQHVLGSQTVSVEELPSVLQLRANETEIQHERQPTPARSRVRWEQGTVDNENLNRKKTKICCIFHPQEELDENEQHSDHEPSSSSSSSSSSSDSDNDKDLGFEERRRRRIERRHRKLQKKRSSSPNAYEVQPDYSNHRRNTQGN
ncbi:hypothetical protein NCAS_0B04710 [Naumovozyma castellii]|uniref:Type 1 phosphatases regulator n=1 Tax=Naumovozyma castellii TaxID=27288 RepID=G0VAM9_NAUCA|nr:hypothetical protein NCAS_0B04710 [Naumovozyma castellii CBS 4309]CCC68555.1 hypothetical protein NCAS_0B04710 [Naumovozyma castellii CBS 4309]